MVEHNIHFSLQIVPKAEGKNTYDLVDKAIEVIQSSGIKYMVTPMETVLEGKYSEIQKVLDEAQKACLDVGAEEVLVFTKMHYRKNGDVTFEEKNLDR